MRRTARAKRCCSGDRLEIASRKALGVGRVSSISEIVSSSLSLMSTACEGSNVRAGPTRPSSRMKHENWRACALRRSGAASCSSN